MQYRIGINLGDVIYDDHRIFGDGINVAARLEGIADRGGICISRQVLDQIEGKLDLTYRELGRQNLKNIAKPVEVYAIQLDGLAAPGGRRSRRRKPQAGNPLLQSAGRRSAGLRDSRQWALVIEVGTLARSSRI